MTSGTSGNEGGALSPLRGLEEEDGEGENSLGSHGSRHGLHSVAAPRLTSRPPGGRTDHAVPATSRGGTACRWGHQPAAKRTPPGRRGRTTAAGAGRRSNANSRPGLELVDRVHGGRDLV